MASQDPQVISRVLLKRAPWDAIDSRFEREIPFDAAVDFADELRRQVASGRSNCAQIIHAGRRVGLAVTRVEEGKARELVLVALFCDAGAPLSREIAHAVEALAREERCTSIRFHTVRPAACRLAAEEFGYRLAEVVMRKDL